MDWMLFNDDRKYDDDRFCLYDHLENEFWPYVARTPMTKKERRALRKWVRSGHSVYDSPPSRFLGESGNPVPFLDIYRMDEELEKEMRGMNPEEKAQYFCKVTGWGNTSDGDMIEVDEDDYFEEEHLDKMRRDMQTKMNRELFYLWEFIASEGLQEEAREYISDHIDTKTPFEI